MHGAGSEATQGGEAVMAMLREMVAAEGSGMSGSSVKGSRGGLRVWVCAWSSWFWVLGLEVEVEEEWAQT